MKASIIKRIELLEEKLKPNEDELPPIDFDLLTACEKEYFGLEMTVLRLKARELGYGDKNNKVSWFDLNGCDPVSDENIGAECLAALNAEDMKVIDTFHEVIEKGIRLTAVLPEEEKQDIRRYNDVALSFEKSTVGSSNPNAYCHEGLLAARRRYEEIMAKHGEKVYEKPV